MPKIKEDLIDPQGELTTEDLQFLLSGQKIKLDCGHHCTVGHNFANTMIILSEGGGKIKTMCHECGY